MAKPTRLTGDRAATESFIDLFDTFLFDCDGVLWSGDDVFEGAAETIDMLRAKGKSLLFVTNNSTKSRKDYVLKFAKYGIRVSEDEIFGSAYSAALYILAILSLPPSQSSVFVLGESGIETELRNVGVSVVGGTDAKYRRDASPSELSAIARGEGLDANVGAVLLALDFHINYLKMALAMAYVRRGAALLATNSDPTLPVGGGFLPGTGSVVAAVLTATGKQPIITGKPSLAMMDAIEGACRINRPRTCIIGDRLDTDIKFGIDGKLGGTLLVLTGVSTKEEMIEGKGGITPSVYADKLSDLLIAN